MAAETYARMVVAHGNIVKPSLISTLTPGGISGFESGFPFSNLEYEDPWTMMKTNGLSGTPTIYYDFLASHYPRVLGILNHNLKSAGYGQVSVAYYAGGYFTTATQTIESDDDIFLGWTDVTAATLWRIQLDGMYGDFHIGSIFMGGRTPMIRNPNQALISQTRESEIISERSAGGAKLFNWGATKRDATMSIGWTRGDAADILFFRSRTDDELLGIHSPEYWDRGGGIVAGAEIFWGYMKNRGMRPVGPGGMNTAQPARYNFTVNLEGAV